MEKSAHLLSNEALATVLLSLRRFRIVPWDLSVHSLLCSSLDRIHQFELPELAKWCLSLAMPSDAGRLIIPAAHAVLERHMNSRDHTLDQAKFASICFICLGPIVNREGAIGESYVEYIKSLLNNGTVNADSPVPELITILRALYLARKSTKSAAEGSIRIHHFLSKTKQLENYSTLTYFTWIRKSLQAVAEPICLSERLNELACKRLADEDPTLEHLVFLGQVFYRYKALNCLYVVLFFPLSFTIEFY